MQDIVSEMELVNGCKVIDKKFVRSDQIFNGPAVPGRFSEGAASLFILKLEDQNLVASITVNVVKSLHAVIENQQWEHNNQNYSGLGCRGADYVKNHDYLFCGLNDRPCSCIYVFGMRDCVPSCIWYTLGTRKMSINGCRLVYMTYDENLEIFVLDLEGQDDPVTMSKQLIKSLMDMYSREFLSNMYNSM